MFFIIKYNLHLKSVLNNRQIGNDFKFQYFDFRFICYNMVNRMNGVGWSMAVDVKERISEALRFHQAGKLPEAEDLYQKILIDCSDNVDALNLLGLLKLQNKQFDEAIFYIEKAVTLRPCAYFYESLGRAYFGFGLLNDAINSYKKALEFKSDDFEILFNLALVYKINKQFDLAIETYQSALLCSPNNPDVYFNMANAYENKNDTISALKYYEKALEYGVKDDNINYFLGVSYLKVKDFKKGWQYYEDRPSKPFGILTQELQYNELITTKPLWRGEPIKDKTLFVYYEAGLGDTIMYARYLPILNEKCAKVLFKPQFDFVTLFNDSNLGAEIIDFKTSGQNIVFDTHIPLMSIPQVLQLNSEEEIPLPEGFLKANPEKVKTFKENYFNNNKFKIGIKWQGNPAYDRNRIIPIEAFYKLFELPNTKFYSLQKDDGAEELEKLSNNFEITNLGSTFNDFADTAAAVENLDLVICNDTSVAHLVGALGKPCWVLLPFVSNWRWHMDMSYSPWYNSVKIFKQNDTETWSEVFEEIYKELNKII